MKCSRPQTKRGDSKDVDTTLTGIFDKEVSMLLYKACPRCRGDMHTNSDIYGEYKECLQCGLMEDVEQKKRYVFSAELTKRRRKKAVREVKVAKAA